MNTPLADIIDTHDRFRLRKCRKIDPSKKRESGSTLYSYYRFKLQCFNSIQIYDCWFQWRSQWNLKLRITTFKHSIGIVSTVNEFTVEIGFHNFVCFVYIRMYTRGYTMKVISIHLLRRNINTIIKTLNFQTRKAENSAKNSTAYSF